MNTFTRLLATMAMVGVMGSSGLAQDHGIRKSHNPGRSQARAESGALKVGQEAPVFALKSLDGKQETDLKSFRGKRPVILFFGSYT